MSPRPPEIPGETEASAPCRLLAWDSAFFGCRIARVAGSRLDPAGAERIASWCRAHRIDCVYLLADAADPATPLLAEAEGFRLVDVRITLGRALGPGERAPVAAPAGDRAGGSPRWFSSSRPSPEAWPAIRPACADDLPELRRIAGESHRDSRFYYDGHFERARCDELYAVWIEKSCRAAFGGRAGRDEPHGAGARAEVFVAELDRGAPPAGYITCELEDPGSFEKALRLTEAGALARPPAGTAAGPTAGPTAGPGLAAAGWAGADHAKGRIGLFAVSSGAQGRGLGGRLISAALGWLADQGATAVEVVTQGRNTRAQRSYQRAGLLTRSVELWYHRWTRSVGHGDQPVAGKT